VDTNAAQQVNVAKQTPAAGVTDPAEFAFLVAGGNPVMLVVMSISR